MDYESQKTGSRLTGLSFLASPFRSSTDSIFAEMDPVVGCTIGIDDGANAGMAEARASILR